MEKETERSEVFNQWMMHNENYKRFSTEEDAQNAYEREKTDKRYIEKYFSK